MARFDVYLGVTGDMVLDCQADILDNLNTRFVVPLLAPDKAPRAAERLNPEFVVRGKRQVMYTQFAAAIPVRELGEKIGSLSERHAAIMNALDMLIAGY